MPARKFLCEIDQLLAGSCTNAKNSGVSGQVGEHGADEQMQCITHGRQGGGLLVVSGGVCFAKSNGWVLCHAFSPDHITRPHGILVYETGE